MPISSLANICSTSSGVTRWLANERTVTMPTKADRPNMVERNLIQAMRDGTALRGTAQRLAREARASKNVTIRMAEADLDLARKQAEAKGLPHQTDIKSVLHEALVKRQRRQTGTADSAVDARSRRLIRTPAGCRDESATASDIASR